MTLLRLKSTLAIDVGNTHCVMEWLSGEKGSSDFFRKVWRISTHPIGTGDEFRAKLETLLYTQKIRLEEIKSITVASVVPAFTKMLRSAFSTSDDAWIRIRIIDWTWPFSFLIQASPAQQIGIDRLVNAEAVVRDYGSPAIIVDSGTATTICAVTKNKEGKPVYLGGAIMPGIEISMESLASRAALLFKIDLSPPESPIGSNTQSALKSGIVLGYASMIDGMVRRFKEELRDPNVPVIATGGNSRLMKGIAREVSDFDFDLTLKGIRYLHDAICQR